jgi:hypothetical protein
MDPVADRGFLVGAMKMKGGITAAVQVSPIIFRNNSGTGHG